MGLAGGTGLSTQPAEPGLHMAPVKWTGTAGECAEWQLGKEKAAAA